MCFQIFEKFSPLGFLILRIGIGSMFVYHGYGKLVGGEEVFIKLGSSLSYFGIHFGHKFFGLMAALSEFVGGICLILGLFFRPACFFLFATMVVAANMHLAKGDGIKGASHAIEAGILFLSLMFIGPGPAGIDNKLKNMNKK
jgi:putative oxidoreductase